MNGITVELKHESRTAFRASVAPTCHPTIGASSCFAPVLESKDD